MTDIHLFGVPYAGGSAAAIYGKWARDLPRSIKIVPLEPAGHGRRMNEPFHQSVAETVESMLGAIRPIAAASPYAICGHSMGCIVTYELVKALERAGLPSPRTVFLSGRNPPHCAYEQRNLHLLSDERFLAEIKRLGGTPAQLFDMPELLGTFLPILRSDYRIIELYRFAQPIHVTDADVVVLHSDRDAMVTRPQACEWQRYTRGRFELCEFPGGHFFINDCGREICALIAERLLSPAPGQMAA